MLGLHIQGGTRLALGAGREGRRSARRVQVLGGVQSGQPGDLCAVLALRKP